VASSLQYALRVVTGRVLPFPDRSCAYCGSSKTRAVGTKHWILQLRECDDCGLKYRFPKDGIGCSRRFYENDYDEPSVTDVPAPDELRRLAERGFQGSHFDKSEKVDFLLSRLGNAWKELSYLDYGASFGYFMHQLLGRGARKVFGFEISRSRARVGNELLGLDISSDTVRITEHSHAPFDVVYSSHVLEHLACLDDALSLFRQVVCRPEGKLVIWVPNASPPALERWHGGSWAGLVGEPHPLAIDYSFLERTLPKYGFSVVEEGDPSAEELRIVAKAG